VARTDNDTWDLASSVGVTATGVAVARALASSGPNPLINDPFAEPLVKAVGSEVFTKMLSGEAEFGDDESPEFDRRRMAEGMAVRTRYFDDFFTAATDSGLRQAVILASGLDSRAYRLSWPNGAVVFEVDQPQVIEFKTRTLTGLGAEPTTDLRVVGVDLRNDWPAALRAKGFDVATPTAWIAEGLLVYLPPDAQDQLFDNIASLSAPASRLATRLPRRAQPPDSVPGSWRMASQCRRCAGPLRRQRFHAA
jgi:methyltransferase (TIGR00027 family)